MLIKKIIENKTMYSVQELCLRLLCLSSTQSELFQLVLFLQYFQYILQLIYQLTCFLQLQFL